MLRLRRTEISASIAEQQNRLRRVESYLDALERGELMRTIDVVVKETEPLRMAETTGVAPGYGHENIGPVFQGRLPVVLERIVENGLRPGRCAAYYEWPDDDGSIVAHLGFEIGDQALADGDDVRVVELPVVEVASTLHRGPMDDISDTYEAMVRWIDDNGYRIADRSRELYLEWDEQDPAKNVTELQMPIGR
jgi:effector-binding domain-containing protein